MQLWSNLSFDPQKTDIDEHIALVATLGNMLKQDKHTKMEKFIETMPTIIQIHLIIEPNWAEVTKKAKNLEHIIQRCEPPATASPIIPGAGAVPGLYSDITQSKDQDSDSIPKPFKSTKSKGGKKSGKSKSKPQQQPQPPPPPPEEEERYKETKTIIIMRIIEVIAEVTDHTGVNKVAEDPLEDPNKGEGDNKTIIGANTKITLDNLTPPMEAITITINMVIIKAEVDVAMVVIITEVMAMKEVVVEAITITNTTNITHMMILHRLSNIVHYVHFVVALITLPNTVLKESMTSTISWRK